jgi:hypothetical protein
MRFDSARTKFLKTLVTWAEPPGLSPAAEARPPPYLPFRLACARSEAATDFAAFELFELRRIFEARLASRLLVVTRLHLLSAPARRSPTNVG